MRSIFCSIDFFPFRCFGSPSKEYFSVCLGLLFRRPLVSGCSILIAKGASFFGLFKSSFTAFRTYLLDVRSLLPSSGV